MYSKKRPDLKGITTIFISKVSFSAVISNSKKRPDLKGITTIQFSLTT